MSGYGLGHLVTPPTKEAGRAAGQIADEATGLYLEYVQEHGYDEETARAQVILDTEEGYSMDVEQLSREMEAARDELSVPPPADLPF